MRCSKILALSAFALVGLSMVACGKTDDNVGTDSANIDSFARPTSHGALMFGTANPAELTETQRFHSWTFTLSDKASVDLATDLHTVNLDSVIYLYKKAADGSWGENIASNDNETGKMSSRLKGTFDAGEYMLKVKATNALMRGSFDVVAACTGAGCPAPAAGECKTPAATAPAPGHYAKSCATLFAKIAATPSYPAPASCAAIESAAKSYYKAYWSDLGAWEDMTGGEPDPAFEVTVDHHPDAGTLVTVSLGGDEDSMKYVFDASAKLRHAYQSNQSPTWEWYCEGATANEPAEGCLTNMRGGFPRAGEAPVTGTVMAGQQADHEYSHVEAALDEYIAVENVSAGAALSFAYRRFEGDYDFAAEVKISAPGRRTVTYVVSGDPRDGVSSLTLVLRTDSNGSDFLCRSPSSP